MKFSYAETKHSEYDYLLITTDDKEEYRLNRIKIQTLSPSKAIVLISEDSNGILMYEGSKDQINALPELPSARQWLDSLSWKLAEI